MAFGLVLEFDGIGEDDYWTVNKLLGLGDPVPGADWPAGLSYHAGGATDGGGWTVIEIWESKEAQGAFMQSRLGPALAQAGAPAPVRTTWSDLVVATPTS